MGQKQENLFKCLAVFNGLYGLTGVCILLLSAFLIIKYTFNSLNYFIGIIGLIILIFMFIGFLCKKRLCVIKIYMFLLVVSILFFGAIGILLQFKKKMLIEHLIKQFNDSKYYIKELSIGGHFSHYIVAYIFSFISLITIIAAWIYHCSIYELVRKVKKEEEYPILRDLSFDDSVPIVIND